MTHDPATCEGCQAVRAIPAHRVNAYVKRLAADGAGHDDNHTGPNLGAEFDKTGGGHLYRDEGVWRWDGIADRHKKGRGR
jgi:hypothetical protein